MMTTNVLRGKPGRAADLAPRRDAPKLCVFGSVPLDGPESASDLDLQVDLKPCYSLNDLGTRVDLVAEAGLRPALHERVLGNAVPL